MKMAGRSTLARYPSTGCAPGRRVCTPPPRQRPALCCFSVLDTYALSRRDERVGVAGRSARIGKAAGLSAVVLLLLLGIRLVVVLPICMLTNTVRAHKIALPHVMILWCAPGVLPLDATAAPGVIFSIEETCYAGSRVETDNARVYRKCTSMQRVTCSWLKIFSPDYAFPVKTPSYMYVRAGNRPHMRRAKDLFHLEK